MHVRLVAPLGSPTWWELALAVVPLLVGVGRFALRSAKEHREETALTKAAEELARNAELAATTNTNSNLTSPRRERVATVITGVMRARGWYAPQGQTATIPVDRREMLQMERAASDLSWIGTLLLSEAVLIIFIVLHHFGDITDHYTELLHKSNYDVAMLALLMVRTAAYGTVVSTALYVLVRFAGTCFDQATRFQKRTHSAHVLNYVVAEYEDNIKSEKVTLHNALEVFQAWNANVQSAFTNAKLVKDKQESVSGSLSPIDGAAFSYGQRRAAAAEAVREAL